MKDIVYIRLPINILLSFFGDLEFFSSVLIGVFIFINLDQ